MFSIGEFSRMTGLTVKTLRFYHEEGLLVPGRVDGQTGYRYYEAHQIESARVITYLRSMELPLAEIRQILAQEDEAEVLDVLERHKALLTSKINQFRNVVRSLDEFINEERQARIMSNQSESGVQERMLEPMLIAGVRMKGKYSDCGKGFAQVARSFGRYLGGKGMLLHYDREFHEDDANYEACMPLRRRVEKKVDGISVRELPGGRCVSLLHKGPYEQLGRSYARITQYIKEKGYLVATPTREVYLKGPGMIFRGNPKNYLTEIQMIVEQA
jgi:DNA-binding transcriptional MerR regulator